MEITYFKGDLAETISNAKSLIYKQKVLIAIFMSASFLPPIFVSFIGLVFPFLTLGTFLVYIEKDQID